MLSSQQLSQVGDAVFGQLAHIDERRRWGFGMGNTYLPISEDERAELIACRLRERVDLWLALQVKEKSVSFIICQGRSDGGGECLLAVDLWCEGQLMVEPFEERLLSSAESTGLAIAMAALSRVMLAIVRALDSLEEAPQVEPPEDVDIRALELTGDAYRALQQAKIKTVGQILDLGVTRFQDQFKGEIRDDIIRSLATAGYSFEKEQSPDELFSR